MKLFNVMIHHIYKMKFFFVFYSLSIWKNNAKVDVPNMASRLRHAPKVCGCYSIPFSCSSSSFRIGLHSIRFIALVNQLQCIMPHVI